MQYVLIFDATFFHYIGSQWVIRSLYLVGLELERLLGRENH